MDSVFESIKRGLEEACAYENETLNARKDVFHIEPIHTYAASDIKKIRNGLGMTQFFFAGFMGVSQKTVESWEAGRNQPNGSACRILRMVEMDPQLPERFHFVSR